MVASDSTSNSTRFLITISRQMGSLGGEVARLTAERLGYRFIWREVIHMAARRAGTPEAALAAIDELGLLSICLSPEDCQAYRQAVQRIMEEMALEGNAVILGRAGQVILHGWPTVLHVRVIAPVQVRIQRVAERQKVPLKCAQEQVKASDRYRRNYLKRFYNARWDDPELYDLVINTERIAPPLAAALISQALALSMQPKSSHDATGVSFE